MKNNLSQLLVDKALTRNRNHARFNLAWFLILREEIFKAIDDGWPIKYIWKVLYEEEKINYSYQTFLKFVKRYKSEYSDKLKHRVTNKKLS